MEKMENTALSRGNLVIRSEKSITQKIFGSWLLEGL